MIQPALPEDLTDAERRLIQQARDGEVADYSDSDKSKNDPAQGNDWGVERTIRARVVLSLAAGDNRQVHFQGVRLRGAKITGALDFTAATIPHPFVLERCFIEKPLTLTGASAHSIILTGSVAPAIDAHGLRTQADVFLDKDFRAKGPVVLADARVGGMLMFSGGAFENAGGAALIADRAEVAGGVFLNDGFHAAGEVRLAGAKIGGALDCSGGAFGNAGGIALSADGAKVAGTVFLNNGFHAAGKVRLLGAKIGGALDCERGAFGNAGGIALSADGAEVAGDVFLREDSHNKGFHATGVVRLLGAKIGGALDCSGGVFGNAGGTALVADGAEVAGDVFLNDGFHAAGEVRLLGARIAGQLAAVGGTFDGDFNMEGAGVGKSLLLYGLARPPARTVNLQGAHVGELVDDDKSWPAKGNLLLDGFVYDHLAGASPTWARDKKDGGRGRLYWLALQPERPFRPQPYEQLTAVLRRMGHERAARVVAIAKLEMLRKTGELGFWSRLGNRLLRWTVGYGYEPWLALLWLALMVLVSTFIFAWAERARVVVPSDEKAYAAYAPTEPSLTKPSLPDGYPGFNPLLFSLDAFFPGIDLHQKSHWWFHPRPRRQIDWFYGVCVAWYIIYFTVTWVLLGLAVAGITGIIRKD